MKMLASPLEGLSVPTKATTSSGQNEAKPAKPSPVAAIRSAAPRRRRRMEKRLPQRPMASVASAEPSSVAVPMTPTSSCPSPSASRYAGSTTAMKPSANERSARAARIRLIIWSVWSRVHFDRVADCLPAGVAAVHVLRIEAGLAQLDRRLAADVKTVRTVHDHRFRLRELADPLLELLGIAPLDALRDILQARDRRPRAHVDDLDGLAGGHHLFHFLYADALDVAELRLLERPRPGNFGRVFVAQLERGPIHVAQESIDVCLGVCAEVHVVRMDF